MRRRNKNDSKDKNDNINIAKNIIKFPIILIPKDDKEEKDIKEKKEIDERERLI